MALRFFDGFDAYMQSNGTALAGFSRKWPTSANAGAIVAADGRFGGKAANFFSTFTCWAQTPTFAEPTLGVGLAVKFTQETDTTANGQFLGFYENSTLGINVRRTPTGEMAVYFGSTLLDVTTTLGIALNNWATVELSVTVHNSAGAYELRVGGVTVLSDSGIDTQPASNAWTDVIRIGKPANSVLLCTIDDLWVNDDGSFLGSWKIQTIFPDGDAGPNDGTPSTGTDNYAVVDETSPNDDTDYVTDAAGDSELFDYQALSNVSTVYAVQVNTIARIDDATPRDIALTAKSGTTTDASTPQTVGSSYDWFAAIWALNPDTAAPWTASEINAGQFGFDIS